MRIEFEVDASGWVDLETGEWEYDGGHAMITHTLKAVDKWRNVSAEGDPQLGLDGPPGKVFVEMSVEDKRDLVEGTIQAMDGSITDVSKQDDSPDHPDADHIVHVDNMLEAPDGVTVHYQEDVGLYYVWDRDVVEQDGEHQKGPLSGDMTCRNHGATFESSEVKNGECPWCGDVLGKSRVYIDDPSEAPEGVDVQEGAQGGLYYVRDTSEGEEQVDLDGYDDVEVGLEVDLFGREAQVVDIDEYGGGDIVDIVYEDGEETALDQDRISELIDSGDFEATGMGGVDEDDVAGDDVEASEDVEEVATDVTDEFDMSPIEINQGRCMDWAWEVQEHLDGNATVVETVQGLGENNAHWFVEHEGQYYDAESPEGVDDWRDLDIWDRSINLPDLDEFEIRGDRVVPADGSDKSASQPTVVDLDKERVYVDDPSDAPDHADVQEGQQGGYYYETGSGGSGGQEGGSQNQGREFRPDEESHLSSYDGEYEVDTEFGATVATAVEAGVVVEEINANEWNRYAGDIDDEDLLFDSLEKIAEDGTKTSRERIKRRLRGMGLEDEEIDKRLREQSGPDSSDIDVRGEMEDLYSSPDGIDVDSANMFNPDKIDKVRDIWENASTLDLKKIAEDDDFDPDEVSNPFGEVMDVYEDLDTEGGVWGTAEARIAHVVEGFDEGRYDSDEAHSRSRDIMEDHPEAFGYDSPESRLAQSMLWYRDAANPDPREFLNFDLDSARDRNAAKHVQLTEHGMTDALQKLDPAVGSAVASTVEEVEFVGGDGMDSKDYAGQHDSDGTIRMNVDKKGDVARTAAHELGHQVHNLLGISKKWNSYPDWDSSNPPSRQDATFGVRDPTGIGTDNSGDNTRGEIFDEFRKLLKNWEQYQDAGVQELRSYQRRHGVEHAAVTFAHWATDEAKLQGRDPYMKHFWDTVVGGEEGIEDVEDVEEGDEIILHGSGTADLYEVQEKGGVETETVVEDGEEIEIDREQGWYLQPLNAGGKTGMEIMESHDSIQQYYAGGVKND